ncbi:DUF3592 domain-containing protein [Streptomyces sp. NPDC101118]|uniref:DUF3592 domain-containing protein n=1 Tax=Streptomyces sp. NPDC101118 TaxID=3366109 RepID=UPI003802C1BE
MRVPGGGYLFFGAMTLLFAAVAVKYGRRLATVLRTVRHGVRVPGECARVVTHSDTDAREYFFRFRTAEDGREVEFRDLAPWTTGTGDPVTVTYDPADPERTATIAGRGAGWSPVRQAAVITVGCGLAALLSGTLTVLIGGE